MAASLQEISEDRAGQRIDNYLLRHFKGVPKSRIYRMLRKGEVRVNGSRVKADYRLNNGDTLRLPPVTAVHRDRVVDVPESVRKQIGDTFLYEDSDYLVIDKPPGIAVHAGSGLSWGLVDALRSLRPNDKLELAHRLDRQTSGCVVFAKNHQALKFFHQQLQDGQVEKAYLALVQGVLPQQRLPVVAPLLEMASSKDRKMIVDEQGKYAESEFTEMQRYRDASLVKVILKTGRKHQIRVHAAWVGHPLAGDEVYGDVDFNKLASRYGLKRQFLHASSLRFNTRSGEECILSAPLADDLSAALEKWPTS